MRRLVIALAVLCGTASAASFVQCRGGSAFADNLQVSIAPAAGNTLIFAFTGWQNRTLMSVRGSDGTDLVRDTRVNFGTTDTGQLSIYRYSGLPAGLTSVTVRYASTDYMVGMACEISGLAAEPLDVADTVGGGTGNLAWQTGPITTTNATDFVIAVAATNYGQSPMLPAAPFKMGAHAEYPSYAITFSYQWVAATGSFQASGTGGAVKNMALLVAYKATEAPPPEEPTAMAVRHRVVSQ